MKNLRTIIIGNRKVGRRTALIFAIMEFSNNIKRSLTSLAKTLAMPSKNPFQKRVINYHLKRKQST